MLIHGFSLVNARLLKAFGTAFYAIIIVKIINRESECYDTETDKFNSFSYETVLFKYIPETKIVECASSVVLDEVAHNEPPHLDLHCLSSGI